MSAWVYWVNRLLRLNAPFVTERELPKPVGPAAHVTGRVRVPLPAPVAPRPDGRDPAAVYPARAAYVDRVPRGGYARAPVDMDYQPDARVPRAVAAHADTGVGYGRPSTYGAGLVDLPGASIRGFSLSSVSSLIRHSSAPTSGGSPSLA